MKLLAIKPGNGKAMKTLLSGKIIQAWMTMANLTPPKWQLCLVAATRKDPDVMLAGDGDDVDDDEHSSLKRWFRLSTRKKVQ